MNTLRKCESLWLWVAVATLTAMPAWADGELDTSFGTNGVVKINFPTSSQGYLRDAATVKDTIIAAGYRWTDGTGSCGSASSYPDLFVVKLSLTGVVIGSPNSYPQNAIECPVALAVDPESGDIFVAGTNDVARFDERGALLARASLTPGTCFAPGILDSHRRYVIPCTNFAGPRPPLAKNPWPAGVSVFALDTTSDLTATTVSGMGFPASDWPFHEHLYAESIVQDAASGDYYVGGFGGWCPQTNPDCYASNGYPVVLRFAGSSGAHDTNYGGGAGAAFSTQQSCNSVVAMTFDDADQLVVACLGWIARFDPTGTLDTTFGEGGFVQFDTGISGVSSDLLRRIYVLEIAKGLLRLNVDGTRDASFASNTNIGTLNGDSSAWQAMRFTDSSRSSVYLLGGVLPCYGTCTTPATTALIARVMLVSNASGSGNGGGNGDPRNGGGGTVAGLELCAMLLLWLWRAFVGRHKGVPSGKHWVARRATA